MGERGLRKGILGVLIFSVLELLMMQVSSTIAAEPLAKDLFPNSKLIWEKEFDGKIRDVQVGCVNVAALWWKGNEIIDEGQLSIVSYLNSKGDVLWERNFAWHLPGERGKEGYVTGISLAGNGKALIVNTAVGSGEGRRVYSYDVDGNFRWENGAIEPGLVVSPTGSYAITTRQSEEEMAGYFRVFNNKTGKEIWNDRETGRWFAAFLNDEEIVYFKGPFTPLFVPYPGKCELMLFDADTEAIKWKVNIKDAINSVDPVWVTWGLNGDLIR